MATVNEISQDQLIKSPVQPHIRDVLLIKPATFEPVLSTPPVPRSYPFVKPTMSRNTPHTDVHERQSPKVVGGGSVVTQ